MSESGHWNEKLRNRPPAVSGRFYPSSGKELHHEIEGFLRQAKPPIRPGTSPLALVVPHAGYVFSGKVAASAFNQINGGLPQRVFILATSHQSNFRGAALYVRGNFETPLGIAEVDRETCLKLIGANTLFSDFSEPHLYEHSIEVQLPFLRQITGNAFKLVPVVIGTDNADECKSMAQTLKQWFTHGNLFVVSTDFSHYPSYEDAVRTDNETIGAILSNNPEVLLKILGEQKKREIPHLATSLCGWTSVLTLLYLSCHEDVDFEKIDYMNSGDQPLYGDRERVVGYGAIAVFGKDQDRFSLTDKEKEKLMLIATRTVQDTISGGKIAVLGPDDFTGANGQPASAFVSIYINDQLRGCIGSFESEKPLAEVVQKSAASSCRDPRFKAPAPKELKNLSVEISVLSPLRKINSADEIEVGRHGVYIRKGMQTGTLLPQVAPKYNWSAEELLGHCARDKAGIGWTGWKNAELFVYEAIVFGKEC